MKTLAKIPNKPYSVQRYTEGSNLVTVKDELTRLQASRLIFQLKETNPDWECLSAKKL